MAFPPPPAPASKLAQYRLLGERTGLRVSPLCLGAMSIGTAWESFMGSQDKKQSFELLDTFFKKGGNFIDTANNYQNEQSEEWIGEWMTARKNREAMVIATKYTTGYRSGQGWDKEAIQVNYCGNSAKSLHVSVNASLKKLQTDYIDILYLHWWDWTTAIEEVMISLNNLVKQGKVLYLGISDTPAWIVSKANQFARDHGLTPFVVYQGEWNIAKRSFERDILPMCRSEGMALCPWGAMGSGKFKSSKELEAMAAAGEKGRNVDMFGGKSEEDIKVVKVLEKIAGECKSTITGIALAYVMAKVPYVFPIVGCRKISHLEGNIEALDVRLTNAQIEELENAIPFDPGFPSTFVGTAPGGNFLFPMAGHFDHVQDKKSLHRLN